MRKNLLLSGQTKVLFSVVVLLLVVLLVTEKKLIASSAFPPTGMTGSPADGQNCSGCHSSNVQTLTSGISTDIPPTGYIPGTEYTITIDNGIVQNGKTRYGFQMTAQNDAGTLLGSFTAGTGSSVNGKYVSHSSAQTTSNPLWQFKWTAPISGTGVVKFYTAVNAANDDKGSTGDQILTNVISVNEAVTNGVNELSETTNFSAFVSNNNLNLTFYSNSTSLFYLQVLTLNGTVVLTKHLNANVGENTHLAILEKSLSTGIYIVKLSDFKQNYEAKIVVN